MRTSGRQVEATETSWSSERRWNGRAVGKEEALFFWVEQRLNERRTIRQQLVRASDRSFFVNFRFFRRFQFFPSLFILRFSPSVFGVFLRSLSSFLLLINRRTGRIGLSSCLTDSAESARDLAESGQTRVYWPCLPANSTNQINLSKTAPDSDELDNLWLQFIYVPRFNVLL